MGNAKLATASYHALSIQDNRVRVIDIGSMECKVFCNTAIENAKADKDSSDAAVRKDTMPMKVFVFEDPG